MKAYYGSLVLLQWHSTWIYMKSSFVKMEFMKMYKDTSRYLEKAENMKMHFPFEFILIKGSFPLTFLFFRQY